MIASCRISVRFLPYAIMMRPADPSVTGMHGTTARTAITAKRAAYKRACKRTDWIARGSA